MQRARRGKSASWLACYARFNQNARFYISEILPVEPGDFHICPRSGNVSAHARPMVARRGAAPLTRPSPYLTARPTSTFHSRVLCSDLQVMMSVSKEAIFEVKFQSC